MSEDINIGKIIKMARVEKDMSQDDLAKMLNVSKVAISNWEQGKRIPSGDLLIKLAKILDIVHKLFPEEFKTPNEINVEQRLAELEKFAKLVVEKIDIKR